MDEPSPPQHTHIPGNRETVFPLMPDERVPYFMHFLWLEITMRVYRTHSVLRILYFILQQKIYFMYYLPPTLSYYTYIKLLPYQIFSITHKKQTST